MNHATARGMGDGVCSPDYLAEFVRAQNYPHLKIHINFSYIDVATPFYIEPVIEDVEVHSDWAHIWHDTCPFRKFHPTAALKTSHGRFPKIPRPVFGDPTPDPG
jgi:hypothetical protein